MVGAKRRSASPCHCRCRHRDQLGHLAQVLGGGGEVELVFCSVGASEAKAVEPKDAFEVREQHLDLLALAPRGQIGIAERQIAGEVARAFVDRAQHLATGIAGTAAIPQRAGVAVGFAGTVLVDAVGGWLGLRCAAFLPVTAQRLAAGAGIAVGLVIVDEVGTTEAAVAAALLEHRDVRLDAALVDQPRKVRSIAIAGIGRKALGPVAEPLVRAINHPSLRGHFSLANSGGRLDIHDHGMLQIDQIVGAVSEEGEATIGAGSARRRVGDREELGGDRGCATERCLIEHREILAHRVAGGVGRQALAARHRTLAVGIGLDQAGIDRKALAADQPLGDAARDGRLEQLAQQIAVTQAAVAVLREEPAPAEAGVE